jgi:hypothetical protein
VLFDPTEMLVLILIFFIYTVYVAVVLNLVSFSFPLVEKSFVMSLLERQLCYSYCKILQWRDCFFYTFHVIYVGFGYLKRQDGQ